MRVAPDDARDHAAEGADRGSGRDDVSERRRDVDGTEVAEQRARRGERGNAGGAGAEAHHLDCGDEYEVDAAEDRDTEDRARDRATRVARLLTQGRGGLEAGEREEAEDRCLEDIADPHATGRLEHVEREALVARSVSADDLREHDDRDDDDEEDGDALEREQQTRRATRRERGEQERAAECDERDQELPPAGRVVPDADAVEEVGSEDAGRRARDARVEDVSTDKSPAGEHAGARAERHADEAEDGSGVVVVLAEPDDAVRDEEDADRREDERERDGTADEADGALRVDVGRHRRGHQRN